MNGISLSENLQIQWHKLLAPYQAPELAHSLGQIATSVLPFLLLWGIMVYSLSISYWLTLVLAIPTAGFMIRTFIIFHDCCHGSFFKSKRANDAVGILTGILMLTPYQQWKHDHAIHHATAGNLDRRGVGDVMTLTVEEYLALPGWKKLGYRIMRNPLLMFSIGAFSVFAFAHRFPRKGAGRRERRSVWWTNLALAAILAAAFLTIGWQAFLLVEVPVLLFATSAGVWLFYVQHNFEGTYWERQDKWEFLKAGLQGSSYYQLPGVLQWFTGNIGFHHIHHLGPRIPNYKLPKVVAELPHFRVQPLTLLSSLKSLRLRLWDEETCQMVGYEALKRYPQDAR